MHHMKQSRAILLQFGPVQLHSVKLSIIRKIMPRNILKKLAAVKLKNYQEYLATLGNREKPMHKSRSTASESSQREIIRQFSKEFGIIVVYGLVSNNNHTKTRKY